MLLGGRVAYFPFDRFGLSAGVAYGNLQGRTQRVSNVLPALGVETAVDLLPSAHIFLPLRVEVGFLPSNGPVIRATAGLRFQISGDVHGEVGLGASVWVLPGSATVSLDGGLQLVYAFGAHAATPAAAPATPPRRRRRRASTTGSTTGATNPADGTSPPAVATPAP